MVDVRRQANEVLVVRADQLVLEVHKEVVPQEALGGLMQVRDEAADVAVAAPALAVNCSHKQFSAKRKSRCSGDSLVQSMEPEMAQEDFGHNVSFSHGAPN